MTTPWALSACSRPVDGALFEGNDVAVGPAAPPDGGAVLPEDICGVPPVPLEEGVDSVSLSFLNIDLSLFILAVVVFKGE